MKISSESWILITALGLAAFLAAQQARNQWTLSAADSPDLVHFRVEHCSKGNRWIQSNDLPRAAFRGLNVSPSGPAKFEYVDDAGTLACDGRFSFGVGSGKYAFQPNPKFADALVQLGYQAPGEWDAFRMMMMHVTLDFARGVRDAGVRATTGELIDLRSHGVNLPYIREAQNAGYTTFTADDFMQMKMRGVSTDFLRALKHSGYDLTARQIAELKMHGVGTDFVRDLDLYRLHPGPNDLVQMKMHGIDAEYLKGLKDAGYGALPSHQITDLKMHGMDPQFMAAARELGYDFTPRQFVDLKMHGVGAEYLRHLRDAGMPNLTAEQITKLKMHGIE